MWTAKDDSQRLCRNVELDNLFANLSQTQFLELFRVACAAVHVILDSDADQKKKDELLEQLKKYPQLVRAVSIVLLVSGDNIRIEQIYQSQNDVQKLIFEDKQFSKSVFSCKSLYRILLENLLDYNIRLLSEVFPTDKFYNLAFMR